jgi:uncharacterized protein involved in response to NO
MKLSAHPLWLVGFRPFFALACLAGASLPVLWALMFSGALPAPAGRFSAVQWHAHEMFFGFGWAVLGGFLLTASKNWVGVRGYHGAALMGLVAAWLLERVGMAFGGGWPAGLFWLSNLLFLGAVVAMLLTTLVRYRHQDSFRDNYFFLFILPAFLAAKLLLLSEAHFQAGVLMALGLFRLAFLVMLERTLTQFMKNALQVAILRDPRLDGAIKLLALTLVFQGFMPAAMAQTVLPLLAFLLAVRFAFWKPWRALGRLDLAIMYLGYAAIVVQLLLEWVALTRPPAWVGSVPVHLFSFGVMGLIIPAMLVRICKGHTGRPVSFDRGDKLVLWIMLAALVARLVLPQWLPAAYPRWIHLAAGGWFAAFAILALRYIPLLLRPRVDGKEH